MLEVQKYLKDRTLADLAAELGIKVTQHPSDNLVILNYDQIDSPKTHPIVRECRGLVLNNQNWEIVARSFHRFFNWGEVADEMPLFDFTKFVVDSKEDGSLCVIYYHDGKWRANTRGSFAFDLLQFQEFSWQEAFLKAMGIQSFDELDEILNRRVSYVCEFVSPWNKVVRQYPEPKMILLTAFEGIRELSWLEVDHLIEQMSVQVFDRPVRYSFSSIDEVHTFITDLQEKDPTNEGVVIRDFENRRWKIKNPTYLSLHRMRGEGDNLYNPKNIIPFVLSGEGDELLTYFPEVKDRYFEIKDMLSSEFDNLVQVWNESKEIESQKDFALAIVGRTRFSSMLFTNRKNGGDEASLKAIWKSSTLTITKILF